MTHFVNHHTKHSIFSSLAVSTIFFCATKIKTDHGILHTIGRFQTLCNRIWIRNGEFRISLNGVCNCLGTIFSVQCVGFFTITTHAHDFFARHISWHCIPYKFSTCTPGKISNHVSFKDPGFFSGCFFAFFCFCFCQCYYFYYIFSSLCTRPPGCFACRKYACIILTFTSRHYHVVARYCHAYIKISECKCKLTATCKLMILPA